MGSGAEGPGRRSGAGADAWCAPPHQAIDRWWQEEGNDNDFGGETVSTGVSKVRDACRGARGLVKTGKKTTANDNSFALAA